MLKNSVKNLKRIFKNINSKENSKKLTEHESTIISSLKKKSWKFKIDQNEIILKNKIQENLITIKTQKSHFNSRSEENENESENDKEIEEKDIIFRSINLLININYQNKNNIFIDSYTNEGGLIINHLYFNNQYYKGPKFEDLDDLLQLLIYRFFFLYGVDKELISEIEILASIEFFKDMDNFNYKFFNFLS